MESQVLNHLITENRQLKQLLNKQNLQVPEDKLAEKLQNELNILKSSFVVKPPN
jgi:arsenate reductase-like glutaredoxin family protein